MQMEEDDDENEKKLEKRTQMNTAEIKKNKTMQMTPQNQLEKLDENSDFSRSERAKEYFMSTPNTIVHSGPYTYLSR